MNPAVPRAPHGQLEFPTTSTSRAHMSRLAKAGKSKKLATGIYVVGASLPLQEVIKQHLHEIVAHIWPNGVLCGKSALSGGLPVAHELFVAQPDLSRKEPLVLEGLTIYPVVGPEPLPGDIPLPVGISIAGPARSLLENVDVLGRRPRHRAGSDAVGDKIDSMASYGGSGGLSGVITQVNEIAIHFDQAAVKLVLDNLKMAAGQQTVQVAPLSPRLAARTQGNPFDANRIQMVKELVATLEGTPPFPRFAYDPQAKWDWLPFFESYFSNFIEGTIFTIDEAVDILINGKTNLARPADAHDVSATFQLASDSKDRVRVPRSGAELIEILCDRHAVLMAARPEKNPGVFKTLRNQAGGVLFVDPNLVAGTLIRGFDEINSLLDPFARAVAVMALVTECHPFDDGNGRVSRLTANAELSVAGQVRFIIPTVYHRNYTVALNGFSARTGTGQSLVSVLSYAQKWTGAVDWSSFDRALADVTRSNAFVDPATVENAKDGLQIP